MKTNYAEKIKRTGSVFCGLNKLDPDQSSPMYNRSQVKNGRSQVKNGRSQVRMEYFSQKKVENLEAPGAILIPESARSRSSSSNPEYSLTLTDDNFFYDSKDNTFKPRFACTENLFLENSDFEEDEEELQFKLEI